MSSTDADGSGAPISDVPVLQEPRDGVPEPVTTTAQLRAAIAALRRGTGPVAVDAERASGYRYSQRAYLVQLRRAGAGTVLIDPIELPDLHQVGEALGDAEWILHAANQDLPCLAEVGLHPPVLFDTELAGRLLGDNRVALGTMVEQHLGVRLEKGYSAADWSTRPLPHDWLVYAALDVELLAALPVFGGPRQRRQTARWYAALVEARELPDSELPQIIGGSGDAVPPASRWRDRSPEAASRLARCRAVIVGLAERYRVLGQNLLASDVVRQLAWQPPQPPTEEAVRAELARLGARPWQIDLTSAALAEALR